MYVWCYEDINRRMGYRRLVNTLEPAKMAQNVGCAVHWS